MTSQTNLIPDPRMGFWVDVYVAAIRAGSVAIKAKMRADAAAEHWEEQFGEEWDKTEAEIAYTTPNEPVIQAAEVAVIMNTLKKEDQERIIRMGGLAILVADRVITSGRAREIGEMSIEDQRHYLQSIFQYAELGKPDEGVSIEEETDIGPDVDGALGNLQAFGEVWARQVEEGMTKTEIIESWAGSGRTSLDFADQIRTLNSQLKLAEEMARIGDALAHRASRVSENFDTSYWNRSSDAFAEAREKGKKV